MGLRTTLSSGTAVHSLGAGGRTGIFPVERSIWAIFLRSGVRGVEIYMGGDGRERGLATVSWGLIGRKEGTSAGL